LSDKLADILEGDARESAIRQLGEDATVEKLFTNYGELRSKLSSTNRAPREDASASEWGEFFNSMGRPEKPDGYKLPDIPSSMEPMVESLKTAAHESGVTQNQFDAMLKTAAESAASNEAQLAQLREGWQSKLKEDFGDKADRATEAAKEYMGRFDEDSRKILEASGLHEHPTFADMALRAKEESMEDGTPEVSSPSAPLEQSALARFRVSKCTFSKVASTLLTISLIPNLPHKSCKAQPVVSRRPAHHNMGYFWPSGAAYPLPLVCAGGAQCLAGWLLPVFFGSWGRPSPARPCRTPCRSGL